MSWYKYHEYLSVTTICMWLKTPCMILIQDYILDKNRNMVIEYEN